MTHSSDPVSPHSETETLWGLLRSFPRPVWVLFAGVFLNKFGTFVLPFLALYLVRDQRFQRVALATLLIGMCIHRC